ncbi:hypothetical protein LZ554_003526 [Drepanopeziza brunnea f. sp. 'monogermtubi']|nr:hypothetical protein LZ554_003526 [Drepanopeziza brunnea f. sp. 'monogermtubi']
MRLFLCLAVLAGFTTTLPTDVEKKDGATVDVAAKTCGPGFSCLKWCCSQSGCNGYLHCDGSYCLSVLNECVCNCRYN